MKQHTTDWASQEETHHSFFKSLERLENIFFKSGRTFNDRLVSIDKNTYHFLVDLLKPQDRFERALFFHIINIAYQAEVMSQGAGPIAFLFCLGFMKHLLSSDRDTLRTLSAISLVEPYQLKVGYLKKELEKNSKLCTSSILEEEGIRKSLSTDPVLQEVVSLATKIAGLEGKIFIESGPQKNYLVEQKTGYSFKAKPYKFFLHNQTWEYSKCKVLIVDGLIEKVSELDNLLQKTHATHIPLVLIAQGFSEEVVATLKINQDKKKFECIPVRIMPDVSSLNVINDISVVCGSIPVSSLKGDLISFVDYDELPVVDKIRVVADKLLIENTNTQTSVAIQVKDLLKKRQEQVHEELVEFIDERLKSLVSNSVIIHLPNVSSMEIDALKIKLDNALRRVKTVLNYGVVDIKRIHDSNKSLQVLNATFADKLLEDALHSGFEYVIKGGNEIVPILSMIAALTLCGKPLLLLLQSEGMVHFTS